MPYSPQITVVVLFLISDDVDIGVYPDFVPDIENPTAELPTLTPVLL